MKKHAFLYYNTVCYKSELYEPICVLIFLSVLLKNIAVQKKNNIQDIQKEFQVLHNCEIKLATKTVFKICFGTSICNVKINKACINSHQKYIFTPSRSLY